MSKESENRVKKSWLQSPPFFIVSGALLAGISLFFDQVREMIDWQMWLATVGIVAALAMFANWVVVHHYAAPLGRFQKDLMDEFSHYKDRNTLSGWLLITEEMVKVEGRTDAPEIWVVSPNLKEDLRGGPFYEVVSKNLRKGKKYKYFVPDSDEMKTPVDQLKNSHGNSPKLSVERLEEDSFFFLVAGLDATIYDPHTEKGLEPIMYLGVPNHDGERGQYQVLTNGEFTNKIIGKLKRWLEKRDSA